MSLYALLRVLQELVNQLGEIGKNKESDMLAKRRQTRLVIQFAYTLNSVLELNAKAQNRIAQLVSLAKTNGECPAACCVSLM